MNVRGDFLNSTGFSPYFLMFGRHPRLAVDAYLGLKSSQDSAICSKEHYATKLKKRLQYAYKVVSSEAQKSAERHKSQYDLKVRESTVDVGDRVLVRNVGFKGKHKLADKWDKDPYVVLDKPNSNIPVFKVQKQSGNGPVRTLHRNMLLPFSLIPATSEVSESLLSNREGLPPKSRSQTKRKSVRSNSSSNSSESESESEYIIPRYTIPQRRVSNKHVSLSDLSGSRNNQSETPYSQGSRGPSRSVSNRELFSVSIPDNSTGPTRSTSLERSIHDLTVPFPTQSPSPTVDAVPRRTGRTRKPPDRYGEWISNQVTANTNASETQIWYV